MKNHLRAVSIILIAVLLALGTSSCSLFFGTLGSGIPVRVTYTNTDFTAISVSDAWEVTVSEGDAYSVVVEVDDNLTDSYILTQNGTTLSLSGAQGVYSAIIRKAYITVPALTSISAGSACTVTLTALKSTDLSITVSDASNLTATLGQLSTLSLNAHDASNMTVSGTGAGALTVNVQDASGIAAGGIVATDVDVTLNSASNATVNSSGAVHGSVLNASHLSYRGTANLTTDISSSAGVW